MNKPSAASPSPKADVMETLAVVPKNKRESVHVDLGTYKSKPSLSVRVWFVAEEGDKRPSRDGFSLNPERLPDLILGLQAAEKEARLRGWLPETIAEAAQ